MTPSMNPHSQLPFQSAKAPLRPVFKAALKNRFMGETEVPPPSLFPSLNTMKRRSVLSFSVFVLLAFIMSIVYSSKENPEKILAQAEAVAQSYTNNVSDIYHQTITSEVDAKGGPTVDEYWYDNKGNYMNVWHNGLTGEIVNGYLYKVDKNGKGKVYTYYHDGMDENTKEFLVLKDGKFAGLKSYDENAVTCYISEQNEEEYTASVINIDRSHPENLRISGMGQDFKQDDVQETLNVLDQFSEMDALSDSAQNALTLIQNLQANPNLRYYTLEENGQNYHVFEGETMDRTEVYYINAESYQLDKREVYQNGERTHRITYQQEFIESTQEEDVFNPSKYQLSGGYEVLGTIEYLELPETGCYNDLYEKLSTEETDLLLSGIQEIPDELRKNLLQ